MRLNPRRVRLNIENSETSGNWYFEFSDVWFNLRGVSTQVKLLSKPRLLTSHQMTLSHQVKFFASGKNIAVIRNCSHCHCSH